MSSPGPPGVRLSAATTKKLGRHTCSTISAGCFLLGQQEKQDGSWQVQGWGQEGEGPLSLPQFPQLQMGVYSSHLEGCEG